MLQTDTKTRKIKKGAEIFCTGAGLVVSSFFLTFRAVCVIMFPMPRGSGCESRTSPSPCRASLPERHRIGSHLLPQGETGSLPSTDIHVPNDCEKADPIAPSRNTRASGELSALRTPFPETPRVPVAEFRQGGNHKRIQRRKQA